MAKKERRTLAAALGAVEEAGEPMTLSQVYHELRQLLGDWIWHTPGHQMGTELRARGWKQPTKATKVDGKTGNWWYPPQG